MALRNKFAMRIMTVLRSAKPNRHTSQLLPRSMAEMHASSAPPPHLVHAMWMGSFLMACLTCIKTRAISPGLEMTLGLECAWYAWSAVRRRRMLRSLPPSRQDAYDMHHKPLAFVCFVHCATALARAWLRHSTGATVFTADMEDGSYGNVWVWTPSSASPPDCAQSTDPSGCTPAGQQPPLIVFPGSGFGAAQYARFFQAAANTLHAPIACLEDPCSFAAHQLYTFPPLSGEGWQSLYVAARGLVGTGRCGGVVDVWSHSNGSFMAAGACHLDRPPRRAVFYEPTALKEDWCTKDVVAEGTLASMFSTWLIVNEECTVKALISACRDGASGISKSAYLLTSHLCERVQYIVDTADADHMFSTAKTQSLTKHHSGSIQWEAHPGSHGDSVSLCSNASANRAAARLRAQLCSSRSAPSSSSMQASVSSVSAPMMVVVG